MNVDEITRQYATLIRSVCSIADAYFSLGERTRAIHLLSGTVQLLDDKEVAQPDQARLLLYYRKMLRQDASASGGSFVEVFSVPSLNLAMGRWRACLKGLM